MQPIATDVPVCVSGCHVASLRFDVEKQGKMAWFFQATVTLVANKLARLIEDI